MSREILELNRKSLRNFAWMFAAIVAGFFGLVLPWLLNQELPWEPWVIAGTFFAWGLIAPGTVRPFYRLWMRFGFIMNAITTRIILGIIFYVVIFPFGLAFRLLGRDILDRKLDHKVQYLPRQ